MGHPKLEGNQEGPSGEPGARGFEAGRNPPPAAIEARGWGGG